MNNGFLNEKNIVNNINNKHYYELNDNLKNFISFMFEDINSKDIIYANKINNRFKTDIIIKINNIEKNISIKTGSENSVHIEKIDSFINFLLNNKVNKNIINNLLLYHYGDDTYDGNGKIRYSADISKIKYANQIKIFNTYINKDNLLKIIIDRFLFSGINNYFKVDYIYYGNELYGIWASRNEIIDYLLKNKCYYMRTIHFSSLTYQNWSRNIKKNNKSEKGRYYIQIKWFSIVSDLQKIRNKNFFYK